MNLAQYLEGLRSRLTENPDRLLLQHIQNPAANFRHPAIDGLVFMAPLRAIDVTANFGGCSKTHRLRVSDISLQPPSTEVDYKMGPIDILIVLVPLPPLFAAANAMAAGRMCDFDFRFVPQSCAPLLSSLAAELYDEIQNETGSRPFYTQSLENAFFGALVKRYAASERQISASRHSTTQDFRVRRALDFIDNHLAEQFELATIARHAGSSPQHLAALFKAARGETIWRYVQRQRLERARNLLLTTDHSLQNVAERVGYSSAPHFAVAFKAAYGMPPGMYRARSQSISRRTAAQSGSA